MPKNTQATKPKKKPKKPPRGEYTTETSDDELLSIPDRPQKQPPIEIGDRESTSTFSPPSPSPSLFRTGEKRGHPQSSPEKENQKPVKKTTASIPSTPPSSLSPGQHLLEALKSLIQAYNGLKGEEKKRTS